MTGKRTPGPSILLAPLLLVSVAATGHHSFFGRFDRQSMMEIEGELTELLWRNPHTYFTLRAIDANGAATNWEVETSSLSVLKRQGLVEGTLAIGDRIKIAGFPPVGAKREIYVRHVLLPDGRELLMDTGLTPRWSSRTVGEASVLSIGEGDSSRPDFGLFRVWSFVRRGPRLFPEVVDPTYDVQSYPMTDAARAALAAYDIVTENPTANCAPKGMPTIMEQPYPIEFVALEGGDVELRIEEYDLERVIHMAGAAAAPPPAPSPLGFSLGAWDGSDLVVTTTRVSWPFFSQIGIPQSADVAIVERFAPSPDGSRLDYRMTVTDPATFTEPVTLSTYWIWIPGVELLPYECQERGEPRP
jgi:Family of unknown function (DUF6152)